MLISNEYCTTVSNPFFSFLDPPSLAYPPNSSCLPYSPHVSPMHAAHRAALTASADVGPLMTAIIINCPEERANPMNNNNNNNNNHHHLARAVGGIAAVPANSSFRHSTYVIKRHSVLPRLALPRIQTTTTTNVIIHNFHTDFFFPLHKSMRRIARHLLYVHV
jgi:hypothetical protein